jgi:hypothetical protein
LPYDNAEEHLEKDLQNKGGKKTLVSVSRNKFSQEKEENYEKIIVE